MATTTRYQLVRYTTRASRTTCPACRKRGTFKGWVDTATGEVLPEQFGACDRATCGYMLSPYDKSKGTSYAQEVYERGRVEARNNPDYKPRPYIAPPPPPIIPIPQEIVTASMRHYEQNTFARLLQDTFGAGEAKELLQRFHIGTSTHWPGATVFWQHDTVGRARGGQVVLFDGQGHTAKQTVERGGEPEVERCTGWVHRALAKRYKAAGQPKPQWLTDYLDAGIFSPCLFGLSQLATAPPTMKVALVEAPKTAALCAGYFPEMLWMATGTLSQLTADRLAPLRGRNIVLYPDMSPPDMPFEKSALGKWQKRAEELNAAGFSIAVDSYESDATPEQRHSKWDLADIILEQHAGYPPSWDRQE
jgi:hypothetical protein